LELDSSKALRAHHYWFELELEGIDDAGLLDVEHEALRALHWLQRPVVE
jgi:hypothetical protein